MPAHFSILAWEIPWTEKRKGTHKGQSRSGRRQSLTHPVSNTVLAMKDTKVTAVLTTQGEEPPTSKQFSAAVEQKSIQTGLMDSVISKNNTVIHHPQSEREATSRGAEALRTFEGAIHLTLMTISAPHTLFCIIRGNKEIPPGVRTFPSSHIY